MFPQSSVPPPAAPPAHFPDMEVSEGGVPPGRPRGLVRVWSWLSQILLPALTQLFLQFLPSMLIKFSSFYNLLRCSWIRKWLRLNSVGNLRTGWGHKKFYLKKEKMFSKATCPKENFFMENERLRPPFNGSFSQVSSSANSASFQVPAVKECFNVSDPGTSGISRSYAEALIADDPELQKSIRGLEAMLRVRDSLGSGRGPPLVSVMKVSASLPVGSGAVETDAVPARLECAAGLVENDRYLTVNPVVTGVVAGAVENDAVPALLECAAGSTAGVNTDITTLLEGRKSDFSRTHGVAGAAAATAGESEEITALLEVRESALTKSNGMAVAGATAGATVGESQRIIGLRERYESLFHLLIHLGV